MRKISQSTNSRSLGHLLTNPEHRAKMTPVSRKGNSGWCIDPAANLLDEDYLGFIARYYIE